MLTEECKKCIEKAETYLALREHNTEELRIKLKEKGFERETIETALSFLTEEELLSEARYIKLFVKSSNSRHPEGKSIVFKRLLQKGANKTLSKELLDEIYTEDYKKELLRSAVKKAFKKLSAKKNDEKETHKMINNLVRAGFGFSESRNAYNIYCGEIEEKK